MKNYLATALFALLNSPGGGADQGFTKTFPGAVTISANGARQNMVSYQLDTAAITCMSTPRSTSRSHFRTHFRNSACKRATMAQSTVKTPGPL